MTSTRAPFTFKYIFVVAGNIFSEYYEKKPTFRRLFFDAVFGCIKSIIFGFIHTPKRLRSRTYYVADHVRIQKSESDSHVKKLNSWIQVINLKSDSHVKSCRWIELWILNSDLDIAESFFHSHRI